MAGTCVGAQSPSYSIADAVNHSRADFFFFLKNYLTYNFLKLIIDNRFVFLLHYSLV